MGSLCQIPYGEVVTYGELAQKMAVLHNRERMSAQAVGGAVGHNAISIIIPCHRVVGANGSLTGYAGGIDKKIKLLTMRGIFEKLFLCRKRVPPHNPLASRYAVIRIPNHADPHSPLFMSVKRRTGMRSSSLRCGPS